MFRTVRRVRRAVSRAAAILLLVGLIAFPGPTTALLIGYLRWEAARIDGVIGRALQHTIHDAKALQRSQRYAARMMGTTRR